MSHDNRFKEPYDVICAKLELSELTIKLGEVTRNKWEKVNAVKHILSEEEELIRVIAEKTKALENIIKPQ